MAPRPAKTAKPKRNRQHQAASVSPHSHNPDLVRTKLKIEDYIDALNAGKPEAREMYDRAVELFRHCTENTNARTASELLECGSATGIIAYTAIYSQPPAEQKTDIDDIL